MAGSPDMKLSPTKAAADPELYDAAIALLAAASPGQEAQAAELVAELHRYLVNPATEADARSQVPAVIELARSIGMSLPSARRVLH